MESNDPFLSHLPSIADILPSVSPYSSVNRSGLTVMSSLPNPTSFDKQRNEYHINQGNQQVELFFLLVLM